MPASEAPETKVSQLGISIQCTPSGGSESGCFPHWLKADDEASDGPITNIHQAQLRGH